MSNIHDLIYIFETYTDIIEIKIKSIAWWMANGLKKNVNIKFLTENFCFYVDYAHFENIYH